CLGQGRDPASGRGCSRTQSRGLPGSRGAPGARVAAPEDEARERDELLGEDPRQEIAGTAEFRALGLAGVAAPLDADRNEGEGDAPAAGREGDRDGVERRDEEGNGERVEQKVRTVLVHVRVSGEVPREEGVAHARKARTRRLFELERTGYFASPTA